MYVCMYVCTYSMYMETLFTYDYMHMRMHWYYHKEFIIKESTYVYTLFVVHTLTGPTVDSIDRILYV